MFVLTLPSSDCTYIRGMLLGRPGLLLWGMGRKKNMHEVRQSMDTSEP